MTAGLAIILIVVVGVILLMIMPDEAGENFPDEQTPFMTRDDWPERKE
jgi:hypothetical protein